MQSLNFNLMFEFAAIDELKIKEVVGIIDLSYFCT